MDTVVDMQTGLTGHRSVAFVLERAGIPYTLDEVRDLVAHIERLRPFPEVPEALARLQVRYPLVVLSMEILTCWKRRSVTTEFRSTM